jgi:hypothetical protein
MKQKLLGIWVTVVCLAAFRIEGRSINSGCKCTAQYLNEVVVDVPGNWSLQLAVNVMPRLPWPCRAYLTLSAFIDKFVKGKIKKTTNASYIRF